MIRRIWPFWVAYWPNLDGFRGTWSRQLDVSARFGPWRVGFSLSAARTREKSGAPDWRRDT